MGFFCPACRKELRMAGAPDINAGISELREARSKGRSLFVSSFVFSIFVNLLMLTGPIFMLQTYDRVLSSRSEATLVALFALVAFLYLMMGILDFVRGRVVARAAARFQALMDKRVFSAVLRSEAVKPGNQATAASLQMLKAWETSSLSFMAHLDVVRSSPRIIVIHFRLVAPCLSAEDSVVQPPKPSPISSLLMLLEQTALTMTEAC